MARLLITAGDRVEYTLEHADYGSKIVTEPKEWKVDGPEYARVEEYDGIVVNFTNKFTFVKDGADYLKIIKQIYGPNTTVLCKRRERHPHTDRWSDYRIGYIDMMTYELVGNEVSVKFNSSDTTEIVKNRESEKIEIEREDSLDGVPLPPLKTDKVLLEGRRIFLISNLKGSDITTASFSNTQAFRSPIMDIVSQNDVHIQPVVDDFIPYTLDSSFQFTDLNPSAANLFYFNNDRDKTLNINIDFRVRNSQTLGTNNFIDAAIVITDENSNVVSGEYVFQSGIMPAFSYVDIKIDKEIELLEGQGLMFVIASQIFPSGSNSSVHALTYERSFLRVTEDSEFPQTVSKIVLAHELGERISQIITSRTDAFHSNALGRTDIEGYDYAVDGVDTGALNGFAHGQWIRGFDREPVDDENNKYKAFTTTLKDFAQNMKTTFNLNMGIESNGNVERIIFEKKSYFFNRNVTGHIGYKDQDGKWVYPQISKMKRSIATDYYFSGVKLGYEKGWENEEAMGLDEYNSQTTFNTPFKKAKNIYEMISKYIYASYAKEFIRRKPKESFPTTDHKNDSEVFGMDLKRGLSEVFEERKWQDDFEKAPSNVFSPETATNLRLSPFNLLLRHGWVIATGLLKNLNEFIRYASSEGNSKLKTQLIGGNEYAENGNIVVSELDDANFQPDWLEFEFPINFDIEEQLKGSTTTLLGETIPNFYGLWKLRNENGELETGFIFNVKTEGVGTWKLLKSNL